MISNPLTYTSLVIFYRTLIPRHIQRERKEIIITSLGFSFVNFGSSFYALNQLYLLSILPPDNHQNQKLLKRWKKFYLFTALQSIMLLICSPNHFQEQGLNSWDLYLECQAKTSTRRMLEWAEVAVMILAHKVCHVLVMWYLNISFDCFYWCILCRFV